MSPGELPEETSPEPKLRRAGRTGRECPLQLSEMSDPPIRWIIKVVPRLRAETHFGVLLTNTGRISVFRLTPKRNTSACRHGVSRPLKE
ncbi:hypothetical protein CO015_01345 [candidate division WWE3 bacterium CG_4_8_14_3_um_filter_42_11]|uniref:Uncharacterized protein n=2 Tax=Katanobacteria TaxID=422282 RepID=A0A2M7TC69_UNCKA|nr:MAG: hypothetical protein COY34_02155 [candidate division WWE3 bacterium CG_4_10_14_0_2_um_filter_42_8]PJC69171.1 MAG: hypothetical protein CO015_01345 [candidate division WWE3 bacterium CG_4_8_14_3_um_filter_42_11]